MAAQTCTLSIPNWPKVNIPQLRTDPSTQIYLKTTLPYNKYLFVLFYIPTDAPPGKKPRYDQEDVKKGMPSEEALGDLAQHITPFWKPLGRNLKVPNVKLEEIQSDNVQYPSVKEKAFQMLMVWIDLGESPTFSELSRALQALGKNRLAQEHCISHKSWKKAVERYYFRWKNHKKTKTKKHTPWEGTYLSVADIGAYLSTTLLGKLFKGWMMSLPDDPVIQFRCPN